MKFSSVSFSEDSRTRAYQICGQILTFSEKKDLMHNMVTTSNRISCMSMHWATTTNQPNQTERKTRCMMVPLNHMHRGHCSQFTILKVAAVSSTTTTIGLNHYSTELAASANTVKEKAKVKETAALKEDGAVQRITLCMPVRTTTSLLNCSVGRL